MAKINDLKQKIQELQILMEDFINSHEAKKNKIQNLESEIAEIKENMNRYLDDLEELMEKK